MPPRNIAVTDHRVRLAGLPPELTGLRVVQMTDFHVGRWFLAESVQVAVALANDLAPDLLVLTGDFVGYRSMRHFDALRRELSRLRASLGVLACLGNHDHWEAADQIRGGLEDLGIQVLVGRSARVAPGLWTAGIDDLMVAEQSLAQATAGIVDGEAVILLSHNPVVIGQVADRPWLVLAGHTHGGQLALPGLGPRRTSTLPLLRWFVRAYESTGVLLHRGRLQAVSGYRYPAGWYAEGRARLYVNRGLGAAHILPLRLNCPPEIARFIVEPGGHVTEACSPGV